MTSTATPRQVRTAIQEDFKTHWDATEASPAPVVYDNKHFPTDGSEYVHFNVSHAGGTIPVLGNKHYRRNGLIILNIFVPEAEGQARADQLAEFALAWIETFEVLNVRIRDPGMNDIGSFGAYWQANMSAAFEYDEIRDIVLLPTNTLFYDLSSGLPSGLLGRNGQAFVANGGFSETSPLFTDPFNQDKGGMWSVGPDLTGTLAFDLELTFAWTTDATGFPDVRPGVAIFAPSLSVDGLSPWVGAALMDRNSSLVFPARLSNQDVQGLGNFTGAPGNHTLTGSELTADGATLHTVGISVIGTNWRTFFDGTNVGEFNLIPQERFLVDVCTAIGVWYFNDGEPELHYRHKSLELAPGGTIYP